MATGVGKTLLIMRHAKSSWEDQSLTDFERPLNARGERDAPRMAGWLDSHDSTPDIILASPAKRARTTAGIIDSKSSFSGQLLDYKALYLGSPEDYLRLLARLDDDIHTAMVVGHNPGLEYLVEELTGQWETMPTAAIAKVDLGIDRWLTVGNVKNADLLNIWRPKEIDWNLLD